MPSVKAGRTHLRAVPDKSPAEKVADFCEALVSRSIETAHLKAAARRLRGEAEDHVRSAKECGNSELAEAFEDVLNSARKAERKAR